MSRISLLKGYLYHWLYAVNRHSLHAPFVYDFYTKLVLQDKPEQVFNQIELYRSCYLKNNSTINTNSPGAKSQVSTQNSRKISNIAAHSLSRSKFCRFLSRLVSYQKPKTIIELGSSLGITTLYLSAAHPEANIYTFEGCPETARLARQLFEKWEFKNIHLVEGNIDDKLPQVLSDCQHVDFAYLDANHKYQPTLNYYECLREKSHEQSIFVLDDIYWSTEMQKAWNEIYQKKEISLSIDLFDAGLLFFESLQKKQHYLLTF